MKAKKASTYKSTLKQNRDSVIWDDSIPKNSETYYYPMEIEARIISLVKAGDFEGVEKLMDIINHENFFERQLASSMVDELFNEMKGTTIKVCEVIAIGDNVNCSEELSVVESYNEPRNQVGIRM